MLGDIKIEFDKQAVRKHIEKLFAEEAREVFLLIDLKKMSEMLCMSERFITEELLNDPRIRACEVKKSNRKRWWFYKQVMQAIEEVVSEWNH